MAKLSEHFDSEEFKCRDGSEHTMNPKLIKGLEQLRILAGKPIHINSGYRSLAYNKKIGGAKNSQHCKGNAADIVIEGYTPKQVALLAEKIAVFAKGGIGTYPTFTHVDVRSGKARWSE
jgi:uncharacterized protein YcbK (DUF882 family)